MLKGCAVDAGLDVCSSNFVIATQPRPRKARTSTAKSLSGPQKIPDLAPRNCFSASVADPDPGSGAFLTPGSGTRNLGWGKIRIRIRDQDLSGRNNPDHISENLETMFWVKILKFFWRIRDQGSGMEKILIRDKYPGSATPKFPHLNLPS